jgi:hypothetical protein
MLRCSMKYDNRLPKCRYGPRALPAQTYAHGVKSHGSIKRTNDRLMMLCAMPTNHLWQARQLRGDCHAPYVGAVQRRGVCALA